MERVAVGESVTVELPVRLAVLLGLLVAVGDTVPLPLAVGVGVAPALVLPDSDLLAV